MSLWNQIVSNFYMYLYLGVHLNYISCWNRCLKNRIKIQISNNFGRIVDHKLYLPWIYNRYENSCKRTMYLNYLNILINLSIEKDQQSKWQNSQNQQSSAVAVIESVIWIDPETSWLQNRKCLVALDVNAIDDLGLEELWDVEDDWG